MNLKQSLLAVATLAVAFGMMPGASATINTNDALTRTFDILVIAQIQFEDGGTGIYSAGAPCPATVFGIRPNIPSAVYYQDDREGFNLKTGGIQLAPGSEFPITGVPCPIPGSGPGDTTVAVGKTNFWGPYDGIVIDQLLCLQGDAKIPGAAVDCFPLPDTANATLAVCNKDAAQFVKIVDPQDKRYSKSALRVQLPPPLPPHPVLGSNAILCPNPAIVGDLHGFLKDEITYYQGGPTAPGDYCQDWFFDNGAWGTDFCVIQVEDLIELGEDTDEGEPPEMAEDDTGYIVTCMQTDALVVQSTFPKIGSFVAHFASHDYKLFLDLDAIGTNHIPPNWVEAKQKHWANELQGWHDLAGKNGFPCVGGETPPDKKAKPDFLDFGLEFEGVGCPDPVTGIPQGCDKKEDPDD